MNIIKKIIGRDCAELIIDYLVVKDLKKSHSWMLKNDLLWERFACYDCAKMVYMRSAIKWSVDNLQSDGIDHYIKENYGDFFLCRCGKRVYNYCRKCSIKNRGDKLIFYPKCSDKCDFN